jgi:hypothetical protein
LRGNQFSIPATSPQFRRSRLLVKDPGMLVNSIGANGLISTDFDIVCSGT